MSTERTNEDRFAEAERLLEEVQRGKAEVRRRIEALIARLSPAGDPPQNDETNGGAHGTAATRHETSVALVELAAMATRRNSPAGKATPRRARDLLALVLALLAVACGGVAEPESETAAASIAWSDERGLEVTVEQEIPAGVDLEIGEFVDDPPIEGMTYAVLDFVTVNGVRVPVELDVRQGSPMVVLLRFETTTALEPGDTLTHGILRCGPPSYCQGWVEPRSAWFSVDGRELAQYDAGNLGG
jgi:hypothetical protein